MAKKAEKVSIKTFPATTYKGLTKPQGFTLVEVLISLAIIAVIISIGAPRLARSFGSPLKTTTRKLILLTKQLHSSAKLRNKTYRLVLEFENVDNKNPARFYVESASRAALVDLDMYDKYKNTFDKTKNKDKEQAPGGFEIDKEFVKKPEALPRGIKFTTIEIENLDSPVSEGKAYIHFFPQGLIQKSIIHLTSGLNKEISLIINPLTGRTDVEDKVVTLKDVENGN